MVVVIYAFMLLSGFHTEGGSPWNIPCPKVQFFPSTTLKLNMNNYNIMDEL